jgi:VWFA-related protein
MSPRFRLLVSLLAVPAIAALPAPQRAAALQGGEGLQTHITQVDTSEFPWVTVYISVTDPEGAPVAVDASRLEILENGEAIEPERIEGLGQVEALSAMLVFDVSGSMNEAGKLESAKQAARAFIEMMRPEDRVGIIAFDVEVHRVAPLTSDQTVLHQAIDELGGVRDTALYDALLAAVQDLGAGSGRRAIIALSDGMDNSSSHTLEQVMAEIGPAGLSIFTVGLGDPAQPEGSWAGIDVDALETLAAETGGRYAFASSSEELLALYQNIAQRLQSEYAVRYESPSTLRDGVVRSLTVQVREAPASEGQAQYNPGGLVPEVGGSAPWPIFMAILLGLVVLLFVPWAVQRGVSLLPRPGRASPARKSRIHLHEEAPREPRIRLH